MSFEDPGTAALVRAAERAELTQAGLVADLLPRWRAAFPDSDPATALRATPDMLARVALCRRPRVACWLVDARTIADASGVDRDLVVRFLRTAEALEALAGDDEAAVPGITLMAARDREEDPS
ncbi:MAG: hypothetical protein ACK4SZ_16650 [Allosphingosinicella sp.]|uniref:hypothetical protein n=1 Tax=Allosphingosinicella sp. TaxID=2823234 RepID=UPI00394EBE1A